MLKCRIDDAIEKLENGSEIQDVVDAFEVVALEVTDLRGIRYDGHTQMSTRS